MSTWTVVVDVVYDEEDTTPTPFKFSIAALRPEVALIEAGQRLERKFKGARIVDARVGKAAHKKVVDI